MQNKTFYPRLLRFFQCIFTGKEIKSTRSFEVQTIPPTHELNERFYREYAQFENLPPHWTKNPGQPYLIQEELPASGNYLYSNTGYPFPGKGLTKHYTLKLMPECTPRELMSYYNCFMDICMVIPPKYFREFSLRMHAEFLIRYQKSPFLMDDIGIPIVNKAIKLLYLEEIGTYIEIENK